MKTNRTSLPLLGMLILGLLAACTQNDPRPPEEIVAERAQARWDALIEKTFQDAWQFHTPAYRERTPPDDFEQDLKRRPVQWISAEVQSVSCEADSCEANVLVGYRVPVAPAGMSNMGMRRPITERWIEVDGGWWFVPSQ
ncbi:MAG: hypothetical protein LC637_01605 [Xanthomonadaceae bacterium]|nr:hypothetical protein [Xanthomonadaceae bacterium]